MASSLAPGRLTVTFRGSLVSSQELTPIPRPVSLQLVNLRHGGNRIDFEFSGRALAPSESDRRLLAVKFADLALVPGR